MQGLFSYPTVLSGPALISRAREVVCSLPETGHWKSMPFFPLKVCLACQNQMWCLCFCSHLMEFTMSQLPFGKTRSYSIPIQLHFTVLFPVSKKNMLCFLVKHKAFHRPADDYHFQYLVAWAQLWKGSKTLHPFQLLSPSFAASISASAFFVVVVLFFFFPNSYRFPSLPLDSCPDLI